MNYPILAAGGIVLLGFLAHTIVGTREALSTRPATIVSGARDTSETVEQHWIQSFCAFHLVTVDLLVLSGLLLVLGATDVVPAPRTVALAAAGYLALWGGAWVLTLVVIGRGRRDYLTLGHWLVWFGCAGLVFWGAGSL